MLGFLNFLTWVWVLDLEQPKPDSSLAAVEPMYLWCILKILMPFLWCR